MTNFDIIKTWDSKRFSEFVLKLILNTINEFIDIDTSEITSEVRYKIIVKNFQQWLDKETEENA